MLGVLGGMGPMATIDFLGKVTEATPALRDQDHLDIITVSAASIPDRTAAILGRGPDPLPELLGALRRLERAGASVVAIPCNTAHRWHASLQAATALPILHIVDALAEALGNLHVGTGRIGLLATDGMIAAGLYQEVHGGCDGMHGDPDRLWHLVDRTIGLASRCYRRAGGYLRSPPLTGRYSPKGLISRSLAALRPRLSCGECCVWWTLSHFLLARCCGVRDQA